MYKRQEPLKSDRHTLISPVVAGSLCSASLFDQQTLKDPRRLLPTIVNDLPHVRGNRDLALLVYWLVRNVHADSDPDLLTSPLLPSLTPLCLTVSSEVRPRHESSCRRASCSLLCSRTCPRTAFMHYLMPMSHASPSWRVRSCAVMLLSLIHI